MKFEVINDNTEREIPIRLELREKENVKGAILLVGIKGWIEQNILTIYPDGKVKVHGNAFGIEGSKI